jgi:hypothetical protein
MARMRPDHSSSPSDTSVRARLQSGPKRFLPDRALAACASHFSSASNGSGILRVNEFHATSSLLFALFRTQNCQAIHAPPISRSVLDPNNVLRLHNWLPNAIQFQSCHPEQAQGSKATERASKDPDNLSLVMLIQGVLPMHPRANPLSLRYAARRPAAQGKILCETFRHDCAALARGARDGQNAKVVP